MKQTIVLTEELARRPYDDIKKVWSLFKDGKLVFGSRCTFVGSCVTTRFGKGGRMLFIELLDGSTVRTLQCICDSEPDEMDDPRRKIDWQPLFSHCTRGATVELTGTIEKSPAAGQPIEFVVTGFKCLGSIKDPATYFLGQRGFIDRDTLRQVPHLRHQTQLFTAIGIIKKVCYSAFHEAMKELGIGEIDPTVLTGNQCEDGAHPFSASILFDAKTVDDIPTKEDGSIDWSKDFFGKRAYLSVSSQLHLEATTLGLKQDAYCMSKVFRAEPSDTSMHLAEFCMPEWEILGGLDRNMAVSQFFLKHIFTRVLDSCQDELDYLEKYRHLDDKKWYDEKSAYLKEKKKDVKAKTLTQAEYESMVKAVEAEYAKRQSIPSLVDRLIKYRDQPFVVTTHRECIKTMLDDVAAGKVKFDKLPAYDDDISRQHEHYITDVLYGGQFVFVRHFPKKIKAFYMPVIDEDDPIEGVEHVDNYDLLMPYLGEVIGASSRIWKEDELVSRMTELGMNLEELDWYIDLRRNASAPHGGGGLGISRLFMGITGIFNARDMQEFPRAYKFSCYG